MLHFRPLLLVVLLTAAFLATCSGDQAASGNGGNSHAADSQEWYPYLGELTPDLFEPVERLLAANDVHPSVRAEVQSFVSALDVDTNHSPTFSDESDQSSFAELDAATRQWQHISAAALAASGDRSQQFKDALHLLISDRYRSAAAYALPLSGNTSCPPAAVSPACDACSPYRTTDGTCNNLRRPLFGSVGTALRRFSQAAYGDGIGEPRTKSVTGRPLPSARQVSLKVVSRQSSLSSQFTNLLMQWGQLMDHDMSFTLTLSGLEGIGVTCCADDFPTGAAGQAENEKQGCFNIQIPPNDPSYSGRRCLGFSRSLTSPALDCQLAAIMSLTTVLLREHNRLAGELQNINPHWSDEKLFQEAKKILTAELQHITYSEFLPIIVGPYLYDTYGLRPQTGSTYSTSYNGNIEVAIRHEFSTLAYRFGHTLIRGSFSLNDALHRKVGQFEIKDHFFSPDLLYDRNDTENCIIRGLVKDSVENFDSRMTPQVVEFMFEAMHFPNTPLDLASLNIQRGRDHGLPSYVTLRRTFGMSVPSSFEDLKATHDDSVIDSYKSVYEDVRDIDAFVGGIGERPLPGAVIGPLFGRIVATQFAIIKRGDRFFYENDCRRVFPATCHPDGVQRCQFTPSQLAQLRKVTLSRLLCDNAQLPTIQLNAFTQDFNYQPCTSLPAINLALWKEVV